MSNLILISEPAKWNSVNRAIEYVLHHYDVDYSAVSNDGGNAKLTHATYNTYQVGDEVFLSGTEYNGRFTVTTVHDNTHITINAAYTATGTGGIGKISNLTDIYLSAGYDSGHSYYATKPDTIVCHIRTAADADGVVTIDVSEYLDQALTIAPPVSGFDYNMSTPFYIGADVGGKIGDTHYALKGTLPHTELVAKQLPGKVLADGSFVEFGNGCFIVSSIIGEAIYNAFVCNETANLPATGIGTMQIQNPFIVS